MRSMQSAIAAARRTLLAVTLSASMVLAAPSAAMAQDDEVSGVDPRIEGYSKPTALEDSSAALTWALFGTMLVIGLSVLFKNAKRTHLD